MGPEQFIEENHPPQPTHSPEDDMNEFELTLSKVPDLIKLSMMEICHKETMLRLHSVLEWP